MVTLPDLHPASMTGNNFLNVSVLFITWPTILFSPTSIQPADYLSVFPICISIPSYPGTFKRRGTLPLQISI